MARPTVHIGTVVEFDSQVGLGQLRTDSGAQYRFHSTAISDGTRNTTAGIRVACTLTRGVDGALEANSVTPFIRADADSH